MREALAGTSRRQGDCARGRMGRVGRSLGLSGSGRLLVERVVERARDATAGVRWSSGRWLNVYTYGAVVRECVGAGRGQACRSSRRQDVLRWLAKGDCLVLRGFVSGTETLAGRQRASPYKAGATPCLHTAHKHVCPTTVPLHTQEAAPTQATQQLTFPASVSSPPPPDIPYIPSESERRPTMAVDLESKEFLRQCLSVALAEQELCEDVLEAASLHDFTAVGLARATPEVVAEKLFLTEDEARGLIGVCAQMVDSGGAGERGGGQGGRVLHNMQTRGSCVWVGGVLQACCRRAADGAPPREKRACAAAPCAVTAGRWRRDHVSVEAPSQGLCLAGCGH